MDFKDAWNIACAELTPQPWDYTTPDGTTLRVIPAGLRADKGDAEVLVRITRADATGLYSYGITGPNSRGVAEVGVTTTGLPALIEALTERAVWRDDNLVAGTLTVVAGEIAAMPDDAGGVLVAVTEVHSAEREETVAMRLPEAQRLPLASALRRALDVARGWEA
ncbi:MAG: hypothetical protein HOV82_17105 [Streptomyces sp.]|nr:hypothetical protein [Streptomyces sp.]NUP36190.1 hypothetical protein [Streptomyces sp.]NUS75537.1 hypothetical protein [Streptomyces sp.]